MSLSLFVLALYIFLQSAVYLAWFTVDPKLLGYVGMLFVLIVILEALAIASGRPLLRWHRNAPTE